MKICIGILFFMSFCIGIPSQAQSSCRIEQIANLILSQTSGQLIYLENNVIQSPDGLVAFNLENLDNPVISLDATRIAWLNDNHVRPRVSAELYVYNLRTEGVKVLNLFATDGIEPHSFHWIGSNEIMMIYRMGQVRIPEFYPGSIINVDTSEIEYIYPKEIGYLFDGVETSTTRLVDYWTYEPYLLPWFSPNGKYLILNRRSTSDFFLVDIETRQIVQETLIGRIWSHDSEFLASFRHESANNILTIYNLDNTIHSQIEFDDPISIGGDSTWSPNGHYIAFHEAGAGPSHLVLVDLADNQVATTCFTEFFGNFQESLQLSWSLDGRYLAFYGVPETLENPETGTIYIYDTETDIAYEVFTGDAEIIGWARLHEENR